MVSQSSAPYGVVHVACCALMIPVMSYSAPNTLVTGGSPPLFLPSIPNTENKSIDNTNVTDVTTPSVGNEQARRRP